MPFQEERREFAELTGASVPMAIKKAPTPKE
jgi:hypothetical protein